MDINEANLFDYLVNESMRIIDLEEEIDEFKKITEDRIDMLLSTMHIMSETINETINRLREKSNVK